MYVKVNRDKIAGLFSGNKPADGDDYRDVPETYAGVDGMDIREFNQDWSLRSLDDRLADGLIEGGERLKVCNGELIPKTRAELIRDGLEPAPTGQKLVEIEGTATLIAMTYDEQVMAGQMAQATADLLQAAAIRYERNSRYQASDDKHLALDRLIRLAKAAGHDTETLEDELALWDAYAQALADVPDQGGFPWTIDWPTRPDGVTD